MANAVQRAQKIAPIPLLLPGSATKSTPILGHPHVYILPTRDRTRLKIGRSTDPLGRIADLIRVYPEIDLGRSVIVRVDAKIIETILHGVFEPYRLALSERRDGYREWFIGDFGEEVVDLCLRIAHHRQARYSVIREVPTLLAEFLRKPPADTVLATRAKRETSLPRQPACLAELALFQARQFVKTLTERPFDEFLVQGDAYCLVRTVRREAEPECWKKQPRPGMSAWGLQLLRAATIKARVDGRSFVAHFIYPPYLSLLGSERGREYYRLVQGPEASSQRMDDDSAAALAPAFEIIWEALASLRQRVLPEPPPKPRLVIRRLRRKANGANLGRA